ncbi:MAG: NAD(P)-dependent glycerol-3-phosphate dehydrogenase [Clostridia bacterium]|nr:NAD(P)-dependent glycerol-3-phosphate dehydrogenase [Clostridia bacterium]
MNKIAVVGSGGWGTALALLLADKGYDVKLWSYFKEESEELAKTRENKFLPGVKLPDNVECSHDLEYVMSGCRYIVSAAPSKGAVSSAEKMAEFFDAENQVIVSITKGLEEHSYKRISEVLTDKMPEAKVVVLSGPSHAEEVARKKITSVVAACEDISVAEEVQQLFMCPYFRVYVSDDVAGVEYGGSLKNVIALCAGVLDGMGLGDNARAALATRGMAEISRLGRALGAKEDTFFGLSGIGDLIVTCTSVHSRNHRAGELIGKGMTPQQASDEVKMVVEGIPAAIAGHNLAKKVGVEVPIISAAYRVIKENADVKETVENLMTRPGKQEHENI